jgi:cell fate (sporulation/competence/biofilm development) regulator YlbF (YheA/YmcA/DUF963 family)
VRARILYPRNPVVGALVEKTADLEKLLKEIEQLSLEPVSTLRGGR